MTTIIDNGLPAIPAPDEKELAAWSEWVKMRPESVRVLCESLPPWHYYDMPKTGQIAVIEGYSEDGTIRVTIVGDQISIPTIMPFEVFGLDPSDLIRRIA